MSKGFLFSSKWGSLPQFFMHLVSSILAIMFKKPQINKSQLELVAKISINHMYMYMHNLKQIQLQRKIELRGKLLAKGTQEIMPVQGLIFK